MKSITVEDKYNLIKKYYKKDTLLFELSMINYEQNNFYIALNYIKKLGSYRLSWFDLSDIKDKNIEKHMSCTYINDDVIERIKDDFSKYTINSNYKEENSNGEYQVVFKANIQTKKR